MAVTKIWPISGRIKNPLEYIKDETKTRELVVEMATSGRGASIVDAETGEIFELNPISEIQREMESGDGGRYIRTSDKGELEAVLDYVGNPAKTQERYYIAGINCDPEYADQEFVETKKRFGKTDGIQCYHGIISFAPGEVTPSQAHAIGLEYVKRVFGENFQAVMTTHLNTDAIHCHYVVNSVSFKDGHRMHDESTWFKTRSIADDICYEHNLSIIENPDLSGEENIIAIRRKQGQMDRRAVLKAAIDEAVYFSRNLDEFEEYMTSLGYTMNLNPNHSYWTAIPEGKTKPIRIYHLGEEYTNGSIVRRILSEDKEPPKTGYGEDATFDDDMKMRIIGKDNTSYFRAKRSYVRRPLMEAVLRSSSVYRRYLYYCYALGIFPDKKKYQRNPLRVHPALRDDLLLIDQISRQADYLINEGLETFEDLTGRRETLDEKLGSLKAEEHSLILLTNRKRETPERKVLARERIGEIRREKKKIKQEISLLEQIEKRSVRIDDFIREYGFEMEAPEPEIREMESRLQGKGPNQDQSLQGAEKQNEQGVLHPEGSVFLP